MSAELGAIMARHTPAEAGEFGTVCDFCSDQWPCDARKVADMIPTAGETAVARFLGEQSVRYRKHSALAIQEDVTLAVEMFSPKIRELLAEGFEDPDACNVCRSVECDGEHEQPDVVSVIQDLGRLEPPKEREVVDLVAALRDSVNAATERRRAAQQKGRP